MTSPAPRARSSAGGRVRAVASAVLGAIAVLAILVGVVAGHARALVTSTDSYLAVVGPTLEDSELRLAVAEAVAERAVAAVPEGALTSWMPEAAGERAGALGRTLLTSLVRQTVEDVLASDAAAGLWRGSNRVLHQQVTAILRGAPAAPLTIVGDDGEPALALDLTSVWDRVRAELATLGVPDVLLPERTVQVAVGDADHVATLVRAQRLTSWLLALPLAAVGLAVVAAAGSLGLARRRWRTGVLLAAGAALTAALSIAAAAILVPVLTGGDSVVDLLVAGVTGRVADRVLDSLWLLLAIAIAGVLALLLARRRSLRRR